MDKKEVERFAGVARKESFFESQVTDLNSRIKALEFDNAELSVKNEELMERVKKLANRQPSWPKVYRPHRRYQKNK